MSNPSARLNGIFQDTSNSGGGNDALRYTAPREPPQQPPRQAQAASSVAPSTPSSVVYSTMVSLYQYDASARKYVQLGGSTASTKAAVGCVIVGSETSYNLLFYNATKQHLCAVPIKLGTFKPTLQAKSYVNFYDEQGVNWSVKFPSDDQVADFMRQIFLAKIHVEIWGPDKTVTKTNPSALIMDDLVFVKPGTQPVSHGDTVAVAFSAWRVVGNANAAPGDIVTKYAPFEKAGDSDLRKIRLGEGSERIKALEEGILGMKKSGKRMVLAPPGKTNGQDWYLLELELLKTKTGHGATQQKATTPSVATDETSNASSSRQTTSRRRSSSNSAFNAAASTPSSRSHNMRNVHDRQDAANNGDLVPYDRDLQSAAAKTEMELKELRLLQREHQLEIQARALERERMNAAGGGSGMGAMHYGLGSTLNSNMSSIAFNSNTLNGGRPMDTVLAELNAKMDYLIRITPGTSSNAGHSAGPSDVAAVLRGVERLASENDRLLTQINSQHQQQSSFEKRCDDLLEQNKRLHEEKRQLQERYQAAASAQLSASSELSALVSARDAAVTQTNRLHAEYQQLLTAYYQLQQQQGTNETEEHKQALTFEREARSRAEKQLAKETQGRLLAEQELALAKKQHDVALQVKSSEQSSAIAQLEQHVRSLEVQVQQVTDEKNRLQAHVHEQAQESGAHRETKEHLDTVLQQLGGLQREKEELTGHLTLASARVAALETELATAEGTMDAESTRAEERRPLTEEIERLQRQVHELEQTKSTLEQTLAAGGLSSSGSPGACPNCLVVKEREEAAERALGAAEAIKREAQAMLAAASARENGHERARLVALFKESVNEMFFRFQDLFEEETAVDGKHVLTAIRKVLKSTTRGIIQQLEQGPEEPERGADGDRSDGPPGPLLNDTSMPPSGAGDVSRGNEGDEAMEQTSEKATVKTPTANGHKTATDSIPGSAPIDAGTPRAAHYPSSDESEESEFHG